MPASTRLDHDDESSGISPHFGRDRPLAALANHPQRGQLARKVIPQLRAALRRQLPDYMVPAAFVLLDELPLTANGKIDRRALPRPEGANQALCGGVAPRNALELELARIFEEILGVGPIGVGDDFFQLGGHSLLAVQLVERIARRFDHELPLAALFGSATIDRLATRLRAAERAPDASPLVVIQQGDARPPLFLMHPAGGGVLCYRDLARALGAEQTVYGLQAFGLEQGQEPLASIAAMVERYLEAMIAVWPEGPYLVGGWSLGGYLAFEAARRLEAAGREVALVAILDTYPDEAYPEADKIRDLDDAELYLKILQESALSAEVLRQLTPEDQLSTIVDEARRLGIVPEDIRMAEVQRFLKLFKTNVRMRYSPQPYGGKIAVFHVAEHGTADLADLLSAWRSYAPQVVAYPVPGEHETMVSPPHVTTLARALGKAIASAGRRE